MVAGIVLRWPCAIIARLSPEHRHVDAGHLRPLRGGVVRHRHVDHLLAGLLRLADFGDGALLALAIAFSASGAGLLSAATGLLVVCAVDISLPALRAIHEPLIYVSYVTRQSFLTVKGKRSDAARSRLIPLALFTALLLVFSLHALSASGQFPREHRAPALASAAGGIVLYGTIAVAFLSLVAALLPPGG